MIATEMATVGMTSRTPKSNILPSGTPSRPANASAPTPGTVSTMPHSSPMAIAAAIRPVPFLPIFFDRVRARGAEMTSSTSRKIDCRQVAMVNAIAYGIRFGPKTFRSVWTRRWIAPVCCRMAPIKHAERDQQPNFGHDVAESGGDGLDRLLDAEANRESQVGRTDDQRDHRIEFEPHDHHHHGDDRDRGVCDYCEVGHGLSPSKQHVRCAHVVQVTLRI